MFFVFSSFQSLTQHFLLFITTQASLFVYMCVCVLAAGEGGLSVQLDLNMLKLTPTFVYEGSEPGVSATSSSSSSAPSTVGVRNPETSVRYFLRIVVFTDPEDNVRVGQSSIVGVVDVGCCVHAAHVRQRAHVV